MALENDLGRDDIKKLVFRIAVPSMLAQFVSVFYSIVDRMYIGNIPEVGSVALAGVGVCGPVVTMVGSAAFLVGVGGSPLMSMKMGEGNLAQAKKILANSFLLLILFSVLMVAAIFPIREPMLRMFGASDTTYPYSNTYFSIYLAGTFFALMSTGMNQFIICQGFAKTGMFSVLIGAVLNIILDPVFIFLFDMGVAGAAIATVLSQVASCVFVLAFLFGKQVPVKITFGGYDLKIMRKILSIGFTPFIIIAIDNVMIIAMNAVLQNYGGPAEGDLLVTCATIVQSFMLIITMPLGGITGGTQTILAFNYGANQPNRVKEAQKYIFILAAGYTALLFVLARTAAGPLFVRLLLPTRPWLRKPCGPSASVLCPSSRWASSMRLWTASQASGRYGCPCRFRFSESSSISRLFSSCRPCSAQKRPFTPSRFPTCSGRWRPSSSICWP